MQLGYAVIFVADVPATVEFYGRAFGITAKMANQSFAQMDTGATSLAFGAVENEVRELGATLYTRNTLDCPPAGAQISFISDDVQAAFDRALDAGAVAVAIPHKMPWGQTISGVRDCNGFLVAIVTAPRF